MIYSLEKPPSRQEDFGLEIPLFSTRPQRVLELVRKSAHYQSIWENYFESLPYEPVASEYLPLVHSPDYLRRLNSRETAANEVIRAYELKDKNGEWYRYNPEKARKPLAELVDMQLCEANASLHVAHKSLSKGFCYFLGGGAHHAMADYGKGFCLINDVVLVARALQQDKGRECIWIIDTDAHKGDGTASLTAEDRSIGTLSIHMAKGWPLDTQDDPRSFAASDVDIPIEQGEEESYLDRLEVGLNKLASLYPKPSAAIVVNGSDPYEFDDLPSTQLLNLDAPQMLARDVLVYEFLKSRDLPQVWLMAGGYGERVAEVHAQFLSHVLVQTASNNESLNV